MILFCGIPSEPSLGMVIDAVRHLGTPHVVFHQREFASARIEFEIRGNAISGVIALRDRVHRLEDFTVVYSRLMDHRLLPELEGQPPDAPARLHCAAVHDTLMRWCEIAPCLVLNRNADVGVNYSKPYQAQLIQELGFPVPETLVTNDPELLRSFRRQHGQVVYKSISQIRSIVKVLADADLERLESIRSCPTQFQQYIPGINVRVHTVDGQAFATKITSAATDYRYAYLEDEDERLEAMDLDDELEARCVALGEALGLAFAGIDLKITPDCETYCLEVNPCPAFSYYQRHTGQPIAAAVAGFLAQNANAAVNANRDSQQ